MYDQRKISETLAQLERYESLASKVSSRERELEDVVERLESSLHMAKDEAARMRARLSDANAVIEGKEVRRSCAYKPPDLACGIMEGLYRRRSCNCYSGS